LALDAFLQSVNNMGLKRHLLIAKVEMMERALRLGYAYFQADSTCRPGVAVQQVEANDFVLPSPATSAVHVAPAAADESTGLTRSPAQELLPEIRHLRQQLAVE